MDRFQAMRLFVRIIERGHFAAAARDLRMPGATATRAVQRLKADLGTRLLDRTTRRVRATDDGTAYFHRCRAILAEMDALESAFRASDPRGTLRIDMQGTLARFFVLPALPDFIARYPGIELRLSETDRMIDLVGEGVDCVLRAGVLPDSSLTGRRVAVARQATLASPAYLNRHGPPGTPDDLGGHKMVAYSASTSGQPYPLDFMIDGSVREVALPFDVSVQGAEIYTAAGVAGFGLIQVPLYRVRHRIASGELVPVLTDHPPPPMPVSVLYAAGSPSPRTRVFVDWLAALFARRQADGSL